MIQNVTVKVDTMHGRIYTNDYFFLKIQRYENYV